jgi:hypothetical protein
VPVFQANDTSPIKDNSTTRASPSAGREDPILTLPEGPGIVVLPFDLLKDNKERGRNNFLNYASQLQATFARSQIPKASK